MANEPSPRDGWIAIGSGGEKKWYNPSLSIIRSLVDGEWQETSSIPSALATDVEVATAIAQIELLPGPQGIQGIKGDAGSKGETGQTGQQGIKGDAGSKGETGQTGQQGLQGEPGAKGDKGDTGTTGAQGLQGIQGQQGVQGVSGVSWATYRLTSRYHTSFPDSNGTLALTLGRLYAIPFMVADAKTVTRIAIHVTVLGSSAHARLGVYGDTGAVYPGARVSDCGVVDCSATGMKEITGLNIALSANTLYWLVLVCDVASTVAAFAVVYLNSLLGYPTTALNTVGFSSYYVAQAYGALPGNYPGSATLNNAAAPKIAVYF